MILLDQIFFLFYAKLRLGLWVKYSKKEVIRIILINLKAQKLGGVKTRVFFLDYGFLSYDILYI